MINKDKILDKLTYSNINKTLGAVLFVLVFIFTFFLTANDFRAHQITILIVFASLIGFEILCWVGLILFIRYRKNSKDINKQKISKAIDKLKEESVKEKQKESIDNI